MWMTKICLLLSRQAFSHWDFGMFADIPLCYMQAAAMYSVCLILVASVDNPGWIWTKHLGTKPGRTSSWQEFVLSGDLRERRRLLFREFSLILVLCGARDSHRLVTDPCLYVFAVLLSLRPWRWQFRQPLQPKPEVLTDWRRPARGSHRKSSAFVSCGVLATYSSYRCYLKPRCGSSKHGVIRRAGRVLVTGGCGYIGSHTVLELLRADYEALFDGEKTCNLQQLYKLS